MTKYPIDKPGFRLLLGLQPTCVVLLSDRLLLWVRRRLSTVELLLLQGIRRPSPVGLRPEALRVSTVELLRGGRGSSVDVKRSFPQL